MITLVLAEDRRGLFLGDYQDGQAWYPTNGLEQYQAQICVLESSPFPKKPYYFHIPLVGTTDYAGRNLSDVPKGLVAKSALDACAERIGQLRKDGFNILVHCGAGIERSPLAIAWYLV